MDNVESFENDRIEAVNDLSAAIRSSPLKASSAKEGESLGAAVRLAITEVFGQNVTGNVTGPKKSVFAAGIALLEGNSSPIYVNSLKGDNSTAELRERFEESALEAGFSDEDGDLAIPGSGYNEVPSTSIGPILPFLLALAVENGEFDYESYIDA